VTKFLFNLHNTESIDVVAGSLQTSVGKVKKLMKLHKIPYIKVGHQWRLEQKSYEKFLRKLRS